MVCGGCHIGEGTLIGAGSVVRDGIKIGRNSIIGAGSVVVKDIPDGVVAYGNPCKPMRENG
jgi:acetyltransferase-like isoleucine patch superfamily enzyme